jgi:hypothetical protein
MENDSEEKPKKHRARRKKEEKPTPAKGLLDALAFIKPCQKKKGTLEQTHCLIQGNWMVGSDGILTIATPIQEDLQACPQSQKLEDVLKQVGEDLSITQLSETEIAVVSGGMKAVVPCTPSGTLSIAGPDPWGGDADDTLKQALKELAPIVTDGAQHAAYAAVLIHETKAVGTDGHTLLEIEHGLNLPPNVLVPKAAVQAVVKCKKALTGFGYTGPSCTFWFEDGSFIKTQLFSEQYPPWNEALNAEPDAPAWPASKDFFEAVSLIGGMSQDGIVYFKDGQVCSEVDGGSTCDIEVVAPAWLQLKIHCCCQSFHARHCF